MLACIKYCLLFVISATSLLPFTDTTDLAELADRTHSKVQNNTNVNKLIDHREPCFSNPCLNGGTCQPDTSYINGYHCVCTKNYEGIRCRKLNCRISLFSKAILKCRLKRIFDIRKRQKSFNIQPQRQSLTRTSRSMYLSVPRMLVHSPQSFIKAASTSSFTIEWYMKMQDTMNSNTDIQSRYTLMDKKFHNQPTLKDFSTIFEYFYRQHRKKSAMSVLQQTPSIEANFFKDRSFVDQRFAGLNVWQTYRITFNNDGNGVHWQRISDKLNQHFDWNTAINSVLETDDYNALYKAIEGKRLFVCWYPELSDVVLDKDFLIDKRMDNKTSLKMTAPIAMFVMKDYGESENLEVVAVQADAMPEAKVFTPSDGEGWFFAKMLVQRADINVLQVVHKRLKSDLYLEPFCLLLERSFSEYHPVYDMLQYHCRSNLETNTLYDMKFFGPGGPAYSLLSMSYPTTVEIINKNYEKMLFDDIDLESDLKRRGLDDVDILPYYPYRDDARLIVKCIQSFIDRFVDLYYIHDTDVRSDQELQQWADHLSRDGNKSAHARGMVKNFPSKIRDRQQLKTILSRLIWQATGYHASVTFPQLEYAAFLPNAPYRIYGNENDDAIFSNLMFGNKLKALDQVKFTANMASSHLDKLFNYADQLRDKKAGKVLNQIIDDQLVTTTKKLVFANAMRIKSNRLPYPYLLPDFITNSVST